MNRPDREPLRNLVINRQLANTDRVKLTSDIGHYLLANSDSITHPNFTVISSEDLGLLFQITDELFFDGEVGRLCERVASRPLSFRLSTRMTTSGGTTTMYAHGARHQRKLEFEIAIATTPLFATFPKAGPGQVNATSLVGGIRCRSRVEALQRIMEHEMTHLIEMLLTGDSNCAAGPFKRIVRRFFGHTQSNHRLLTPADVARKKLGIRPGDQVSFHHHGVSHVGTVNRITKRASVLVPDPRGERFTDGNRYATYYVPLHRLKKAG